MEITVEGLKCCGNCDYYGEYPEQCGLTNKNSEAHYVCDRWEFDWISERRSP